MSVESFWLPEFAAVPPDGVTPQGIYWTPPNPNQYACITSVFVAVTSTDPDDVVVFLHALGGPTADKPVVHTYDTIQLKTGQDACSIRPYRPYIVRPNQLFNASVNETDVVFTQMYLEYVQIQRLERVP
jgi:hypothetical protein